MEWTQEKRLEIVNRILAQIIGCTDRKQIACKAVIGKRVLTCPPEELDRNITEIHNAMDFQVNLRCVWKHV